MIGQFTYTSFDPGGRRQVGWQIQAFSGTISAETMQELTQRITTRLDGGAPLPVFPTRDEIHAFPRRLVHGRVPGGHGLWHTVPAGADAAGRPGNVYVHIVYLSDDAVSTTDRFIDLWRSPDWLTPFGQEEVASAQLPDVPMPRPGSAVDRESVVAFFATTYGWKRVMVASVVLDAVTAALGGGPAVVLGVNDPDEGAQWIGAVSHLLAPRRARGLMFSTFERADTVARAVHNGAMVICVPQDDLASIQETDRAIVIDTSEVPQAGPVNGQTLSKFGSVIIAKPWSLLAREVVAQPELLTEILSDADEFDEQVDSLSKPLGWSLARAVLNHPEHFPEILGEARMMAGDDATVDPQNSSLTTSIWTGPDVGGPSSDGPVDWCGQVAALERVAADHDENTVQRWLSQSPLPVALLDPLVQADIIIGWPQGLTPRALHLLRQHLSDLISDRVHGHARLGAAVSAQVLDWLEVAKPGHLLTESPDFLDRERLLQFVGSWPHRAAIPRRERRLVVETLVDARREGYHVIIGLADCVEVYRLDASDICQFGEDIQRELPDFVFLYALLANDRDENWPRLVDLSLRRSGLVAALANTICTPLPLATTARRAVAYSEERIES